MQKSTCHKKKLIKYFLARKKLLQIKSSEKTRLWGDTMAGIAVDVYSVMEQK